MKRFIWILIIILVVLGVVWAMQGGESIDKSSNEPIKIGVSTILSDQWAALGENIVQAAKLTVSQINQEGGVNGRSLELLIQDAGLDSKTGLDAAQKLINTDGVQYIIGGTASNGTLAAASLVNREKVVYMTPVTGGSNVDAAGEYVFRTANADVLAGRDIADAMIDLGYKDVAVVSEVTEYTLDIRDSFVRRIEERGGTIVLNEEFQPGTTDFRTLVTKTKTANPEAILVASQTGIGGAHFIQQAGEQDIRATVFSDFTFVANEDAKGIVGSFEGIYFADPAYNAESEEYKSFVSEYEAIFGMNPLIAFHAAATHDAIIMLAQAIEEVGDDSEKVREWLLDNIKDWTGLMGTYSLDGDGNSDIGFTMKVIENGQAVLIN